MTANVNVQLGDIQKTLLLPLWGRAMESKKRKPLLVDETAVRIIDQIDVDFAQLAENIDDLTRIGWIKRSLFSDRVVRDFLERYPEGTVVNIGCGLDTTFERIDNGSLRWYDLDLPDVIALRSVFVQENARRKFITASFLDEAWLRKIEVSGNVLFLAVGVIYYFEGSQIREFLLRLMGFYPGCELLCDVCSPLGVRIANKKVIESAGLDESSHLVWGLENKRELLTWDPGIHLIATYYYFRTLRFGLRNFLMGMLSDYLGIQYMLHLRLGGTV